MGQRIVIFGGTFNPVHFGHLIVARAVAEQLQAPAITLMPAAIPPHKASSADGHHRLAMLRLAVEGDGLFELSTLELDRSGPSYTYDTIVQLRRQHGTDAEIAWVIGQDMLGELDGWHRAREVVDAARMIIAARPPFGLDDQLDRLAATFSAEQVVRLAGGVLHTPLIDISSTQIRHRVREGKSIRYLTSDRVIEYIVRSGLYRPKGAEGVVS